jgi:hypothetical protein
MAITGFFFSILFLNAMSQHKALCWTNSGVVCGFDSIFYLFTLFLGGMSQLPFYGMSVLAWALPRQPLENINLFRNHAGDVKRFGRFFALVGLGGLGLICIAQVWLYFAPIKTVWLYVQVLVTTFSFGALVWFFLTQYNIHRLMVRDKKEQLDKVCKELNTLFRDAFEHPTRERHYRLAILTTLKAQLEQLPEWPFSATAVLQLVTAAGAVAGLVPLIEIIRKLG